MLFKDDIKQLAQAQKNHKQKRFGLTPLQNSNWSVQYYHNKVSIRALHMIYDFVRGYKFTHSEPVPYKYLNFNNLDELDKWNSQHAAVLKACNFIKPESLDQFIEWLKGGDRIEGMENRVDMLAFTDPKLVPFYGTMATLEKIRKL